MIEQPFKERVYTIADWEKLPEYPRTELIDGTPQMMAPPSWEHQLISGKLFQQFANYLEGKRCVVVQEVGVEFAKDKYKQSVFIPDVVVLCDPKKITPKGIVGAPDLIIEILSPSTGGIDKILKYDRYLREGVREYWIVDPVHQLVDVFNWEGEQKLKTYAREDKIRVGVLEDCDIDLSFVFPEPEPEEDLPIETFD